MVTQVSNKTLYKDNKLVCFCSDTLSHFSVAHQETGVLLK